jgi:outer membrane protein OmpA-like peptidoglycan-associated protein
MRKLLTCTTALSMALSSFSTLPARAQTLAEDGSVLGPDGAVLCVPTPEAPCDLDAITKTLKEQAEAEAAAQAEAEAAAKAEAEAQAQAEAQAAAEAAAKAQEEAEAKAAEEAAAQAEAEAKAAEEAAAQAEAEAKAAEEAAAQAEAEAQAQAEAEAKAAEEAAAQAEAEAQAQAEAEAKAAEEAAAQAEAEAKAAEEAAAQAEAEAQAQAEAEAKAAEEAAAQAEAEAQAQAEAEAKAAEEAAAQAEAEAQAQAEAEAKAAEEAAAQTEANAEAKAAEEAAAQAEAEAQAEADAKAAEEAAGQAATEAAPQPTPVPEAPAVVETEPAVEPAPEGGVTEPASPDVATEGSVDGDVAVEGEATVEVAPEPGAETAPVEAPVVSEEASGTLAEILALPSSEEGEGGISAEGLAAAAAAAGMPVQPGAEPAPAEGEPAQPAAEPVSVATETVTAESARSSDEEFEAAPVAVASADGKKKKDKLSDLEKVGLLALGALVVGAVINEGKKDQREVIENTGDRVIVRNPDGSYTVYKDDDAILRQPGVQTRTETYADGSTRTIVTRDDGSQVVTVRDASGRVLRRSVYDRAGIEYVLIDDLAPEEPIIISELPLPREDRVTISTADSDAALRAEMAALDAEGIGRKFSLRQIRDIREVRALAATVEVDTITFDTGSSVIRTTEARKLAALGQLMQDLLAQNPRHIFLIEGHTDAVGSGASNLLLSDRRAESLAKALTEYFDIPPENLVVQGYGESELKIETLGDERLNRRVNVRLITPLMRTADLQ